MANMLEAYRGGGLLSPFGSFSMMPGFLAESKRDPGLSIYEDKNSVVVSAAIPGIDPKQVKLQFNKGILTIQGEKKEEKEDKSRNYFQKSAASFLYHLHVPGQIDKKMPPKIEFVHGVIKVIFAKPKKMEFEKKVALLQKAKPLPLYSKYKPHVRTQKQLPPRAPRSK